MGDVTINWHKSTHSGGNGGNCVEVAQTPAGVLVRDTKQHGAGPLLVFTPAEWTAFTAGVRGGEFDLA